MEIIDKLKLRPRDSELYAILCKLHETKSSVALELARTSALLQVTVPEVYVSSSSAVKAKIIALLQCPSGVGGLVNFLAALAASDASSRQTYGQVLADLFNENLLRNVLVGANSIQIKTITKLIFKGKCFEAYNMSGCGINSPVLSSSETYVTYLTEQLVETYTDSKTFNECFLGLLSFNMSCIYVVFDVVFARHNWAVFVGHFKSMKLFERKKVLAQFLRHYTKRRFLSDGNTSSNVEGLYAILREANPAELMSLPMLQNVITLQNTSLNSLVVLLTMMLSPAQVNDIFQQLLEDWGNESIFKSEIISIQESKTHFLIQLLYYKDRAFAYSLTTTTQFVECISKRLNSHSDRVRSLGVILADQVCLLAKKEKIFAIPIPDDLLYLTAENSYHTTTPSLSIEDAWKLLEQPIITIEEDHTPTVSPKNPKPKIYKDSDDESSSDSDSDDGDDPSVQRNPRVPTPVYIDDLVKYLTVEKEHQQAYDMRQKALITGPTLIRQKSGFGSEVKLNASELMHVLAGMTNIFEEPDFDELRLNCLIAVLVSYPEAAKELATMLGSGDYSLAQRMCILSSLSLAARELRGFKDDPVVPSYKEKQFPTKMLPPTSHNRYSIAEQMQSLNIESQAYKSLQDDLMVEKSEAAKDELAGGKILRMSRKLRKPVASSGVIAKIKDHSKIISSNFYYPLISLWIEVGGIDVGHYSSVLTAHYIKTLSLILHSSYSSSHESYDMIREFLLVTTAVVKAVAEDQIQVIEAVVTGLLLVCDICDEDRLISEFSQSVVLFQVWLSGVWEGIIDKSVKSLSAGLLLRLTSMLEKRQGTLIDQFNGMY